MKPATFDATATQLETIHRTSPKTFAAFAQLIDGTLRRLKTEAAQDRGVRGRLLSRLQAVHDCDREDGGGFEQVEPLGRIRQWRCLGCDRVVHLEKP